MDCAICHQPYNDTHECKKPNAPGEGSELPAPTWSPPLTAGNRTLDQWRSAELIVFDRRSAYKSDSLSAIYKDIAIDLQAELTALKAALSSPQQEWIEIKEGCEMPQEDCSDVQIVVGGEVSTGYYMTKYCAWMEYTLKGTDDCKPTHWTHLLAPPVTAEAVNQSDPVEEK